MEVTASGLLREHESGVALLIQHPKMQSSSLNLPTFSTRRAAALPRALRSDFFDSYFRAHRDTFVTSFGRFVAKDKLKKFQSCIRGERMYIDVQLLSKPSRLPLVGLPNHYSTLLTTTLYHPMVWMDYYVE